MTARRVIGGVGRGLVLVGVLILLFVAYQLWGTGLREAQAQNRLKDQLEQLFEADGQVVGGTTTTTAPGPTTTVAEITTTTAPPPLRPVEGEAVALIEIPRIGVDKAVVSGVGVPDLKKGPGHYPETPLPGNSGNVAIAGHRTTYGAPFYDLNELEVGDDIVVTTVEGRFRYVVSEEKVVTPDQVEVLGDFGDNRLTLTTCNPRYSARERLIIVAHLDGPPVDVPAPEPAPEPEPEPEPEPIPEPDPGPGDGLPGEDVPSDGLLIGAAGLSGEGAANGPVVLWGLLALAVLVGEWALAHWWRKWTSYLLVTPVFLVVLFLFYENVSRLLPANI